jgi:hypothetical protein
MVHLGPSLFWDVMQQTLKVKDDLDYLTIDEWTNMLYRNVANQLLIYTT